ncbi:MAG TPA: VWA domain-containing protein [Vicinamibacteria bacterium]|nr:VWA domain-containing protein [Vicinamibacteria bacterium]
MSFLSPWLWLGALAAAAPLWLHLRARSRRVVRFAALRFIEDQPRPRRRGFRLRDPGLFAIRLLALLMLVAAFAWPYVQAGRGRVVESRVLVLDNTLSQQVAGGFKRDRGRVLAALRQAGAETQVAVVELKARPRVVAGFGEPREEALSRVQALTPSFERGSYLEALRLAQSLLDQSLGERRRVSVYADQQANQWSENETSPPFLAAGTLELGAEPPVLSRPNLSLADPAVRRVFVGERAVVDLAVQLRKDGPFAAARVRLEANGRIILRETLRLRADQDLLTVRGRWVSDPGRWLTGEMVLENAGDGLPADDRVSFCLPPVEEGRVALLARSPYLKASLAPETMKGRWATQALDPTNPTLAEAPDAELADVLVLEGDYAQSERVRQLAFRYLNGGRGVILLLARSTPLLRGFLEELGVGVTGAAPNGPPQGFRYVATDHPVFKPFLGGELGDLLEPRVFSHLRLSGREAVPLAFGASGDPLVLEGTGTKGRLLIFAFAFTRQHTDWPVLPSFLPFLDLTLQHARSATPIETSLVPGELLLHSAPPGQRPRELVLRAGTRELARAAFDESGRARLTAPGTPGLYGLAYDADPATRAMVAVNPPPRESELRYLREPAALRAWSRPPAAEKAPGSLAGNARSRAQALDQRLWWWALLAAVLALGGESALLWRRQEAT